MKRISLLMAILMCIHSSFGFAELSPRISNTENLFPEEQVLPAAPAEQPEPATANPQTSTDFLWSNVVLSMYSAMERVDLQKRVELQNILRQLREIFSRMQSLIENPAAPLPQDSQAVPDQSEAQNSGVSSNADMNTAPAEIQDAPAADGTDSGSFQEEPAAIDPSPASAEENPVLQEAPFDRVVYSGASASLQFEIKETPADAAPQTDADVDTAIAPEPVSPPEEMIAAPASYSAAQMLPAPQGNPGGQVILPSALTPDNMSPMPEFPVNFNGEIRTMPEIAGISSDPAKAAVTATDRGETVAYNTSTVGWAGGGFTYDNFGTIPVETSAWGNLSVVNFGLRGDAKQVKLEVIDDQNNKAVVYLAGIRADQEQVWAVPPVLLYGINLAKVRLIYFIVEGANQTGTLEINRKPIAQSQAGIPPSGIAPAQMGSIPEYPVYFNGSVTTVPEIASVSSSPAYAASIKSDRGVTIQYKTSTVGWAGGGFTYDLFATASIETADWSKLGSVQFGLKGNAARVKLEVLDNQNNKAVVYLNGIRSDKEQVWSIPLSALGGMNLSKVRLVYFIIEGVNQNGNLDVSWKPAPTTIPTGAIPPSALQPSDLTGLPQYTVDFQGQKISMPQQIGLASEPATGTGSWSSRGVLIDYNTSTVGWAGGGLTFNHFGTPAVESIDLSTRQDIRFGLVGNPAQVKVEFQDADGRKTAVNLSGIRGDKEQVWSISTSRLGGIDLTHVTLIYFIIEGQNQKGGLFVFDRPSQPNPSGRTIQPSAAVTPVNMTALPEFPVNFNGQIRKMPEIAGISSDPAKAVVAATNRGEIVQYDTNTIGWAGGGFTYDQFGTQTVETADWSKLANVQFGIKGDAPQVKLEVIDNKDSKTAVYLTAIRSEKEQVWVIPTAQLVGIDLTHVRLMYFIVEGQNQKGTIEINRKSSVWDEAEALRLL